MLMLVTMVRKEKRRATDPASFDAEHDAAVEVITTCSRCHEQHSRTNLINWQMRSNFTQRTVAHQHVTHADMSHTPTCHTSNMSNTNTSHKQHVTHTNTSNTNMSHTPTLPHTNTSHTTSVIYNITQIIETSSNWFQQLSDHQLNPVTSASVTSHDDSCSDVISWHLSSSRFFSTPTIQFFFGFPRHLLPLCLEDV